MIVDKESPIPNSLSMPAVASFVVRAKSKEDIVEIVDFAKKEGLPLFPLGDGTNIVPHDYVKAVVAILDIKGKDFSEDLKIGAGENWDDMVRLSVENEWSGIEALSLIPGKVGAGPIQNIGAYGVEISNHIEKVEVFDREKGEFIFLNKNQCQFGYRNSLFKKYPEKFIVVSVNLKLSKESPEIPEYKDVKNYFNEKGNNSPNLKEIREAIINIRKNKLPDPSLTPNVGSYFTNPILEKEKALTIKNEFPEIPLFPFENKIKISAGWLIEQVGLKGAKIGKIEMSAKNALVLTNPNKANFEEVRYAENFIRDKVLKKFGITLEREPRVLGYA